MTLVRIAGELEVLGRNSAMKLLLEKSEQIEAAIAECSDRRRLRTLNKAWWKVQFWLEKFAVEKTEA